MVNEHPVNESESDSLLDELRLANSRLSDEAFRRRRWSTALADVTAAMVSGDDAHILDVIADRVATLADADFVSVITPRAGTEQFVVQAVYGQSSEHIRGRVLEPSETLAPTAMAQQTALILEEVESLPGYGAIGPIVMMPLLASGSPIGALSVARRPGAPSFRGTELAMVSEFGRQASVAVELARAQADSRRLAIVEERNRIARDLHDHVIQRLFAAGLTLTKAAGATDDGTAETINRQVDAIEAAISDIRTAVSTLRMRPSQARDPLRVRVMKVMGEFNAALEETPRFTSSGPVDHYVTEEIASEVLAVVRELMSNVAQHAQASHCTVGISLTGDNLAVTVEDDGLGIDAPSRRSGLGNLTERAQRLGGTFHITNATPRGTIARWQIPLNTSEESSP
ncbi:GAF domain-containing sensor histidine kinase [Microbacterium sp.]|uniref:sensor histidine kinase n=1 Tax=Microbacterium sp. TaxID=51671 RepID=UPI002736ADBC|nr:GAF domain-containing sensor histidine kinase [Microbacterium sp.]MDP3950647.1 GAF domain-containing sensor histidine kinase [Microbacterium sp.]